MSAGTVEQALRHRISRRRYLEKARRVEGRQQAAQIGRGGRTGGIAACRILPVADTGEEGADAAFAYGQPVHLHVVLLVGEHVLRLHEMGSVRQDSQCQACGTTDLPYNCQWIWQISQHPHP